MKRTRLFSSLIPSVVAAGAFAIGAGCTGDMGDPGDPGDPGVTVTVSPAVLTVTAGDSGTLSAQSTNAAETLSWSSSNTDVATVDGMGTVTGVAVGTAVIAATGDTSGATGLAGVSVTEPPAGPVSFADDLMPLFTENDVWFTGGQACNATGCHTGVGGAHDLDMGSYAGVLLGADAGEEPIIDVGEPGESSLRKRMRNNRMPWGIPPTAPRNGPRVMDTAALLGWVDASSAVDQNGLVLLVEAWIGEGAPNGDFDYTDSTATVVTKSFGTDILPLFTTDNVWWPGTEACNAAGCHNGVGGAHDLDMGTHAGILLGADAGDEPILDLANPGDSGLRKRLRNNRMPWGMPTWVPRNGPNGEVDMIVQWIEDGAQDN